MRPAFEHPLAERYASPEMVEIFTPRRKFTTWRRLWVALAEGERRLGLAITAGQVAQLRRHVDDLNLGVARKYERRLRHDVMAHIRAYGDQCPGARGIIHLGATSAYVVDNTDLILMRDALRLVCGRLAAAIGALAGQARRHADEPCVAYTHFQPAQLTTVGKRIALWIQDLLEDLRAVEQVAGDLRFLGVKGATGTQASFMNLFDGNASKVRRLDVMIARAFGFERTYAVTGQTYPRKVDAQVHAALAGLAQSAHKMATDLRLWQHLGEALEPFGREQVGSSAMAYKRNPMKAERICSLARLVMALEQNALQTAAVQWMERTLDDSAGKRIALPEVFLAADAILSLTIEIARGLEVRTPVLRAHVSRELPFMATENILMEAVRHGGDRQTLHERIRRHSLAAVERMTDGASNDLLDRLRGDDAFRRVRLRVDARAYVGRAPAQTREFLRAEVAPALKRYRKEAGYRPVLHV